MPKEQINPLNTEEMERLLDASMEDDFCHMLFVTARSTGRRLGEFYGVEAKIKIGEKNIGIKTAYDIKGNKIQVARTTPVYKKTNKWRFGVKVEDINFDEGIMKVWVLKRRKFEQDETVLPKECLRLIRQYVMKHKIGLTEHLFRKYSYRQIQNKVKSFSKKAEIKKNVSFHNFRHYFISELARQGWSHDKIARVTGHKTISTLKIYDHVVAKDMKAELEEAVGNF